MNVAKNIKNKNFKGLRIAGTITTVIAYGLLVAYFIYTGVSAWQEAGVWAWMFLLLGIVSIFGFAVEMNMLWGELKRKDGTIEEMRKGTLIATIVLNAFIAFLAVMFWIAELSL